MTKDAQKFRDLLINEEFKIDELMTIFDYDTLGLMFEGGQVLFKLLETEFIIMESVTGKELVLKDEEKLLKNLDVVRVARKMLGQKYEFNMN